MIAGSRTAFSVRHRLRQFPKSRCRELGKIRPLSIAKIVSLWDSNAQAGRCLRLKPYDNHPQLLNLQVTASCRQICSAHRQYGGLPPPYLSCYVHSLPHIADRSKSVYNEIDEQCTRVRPEAGAHRPHLGRHHPGEKELFRQEALQ